MTYGPNNNIDEWHKFASFKTFEIACLMNDIDPRDHTEKSMAYLGSPYFEKILMEQKNLISFIGTEANDENYQVEKEIIASWYKYMGKSCPSIFKPIIELEKKPSYLDPKHADYCPELQLAIDVCEAVYIDKLMPAAMSNSAKIRNYLEKNFESDQGNLKSTTTTLPVAFVDRIRGICTAKKTVFKKS